MEENCELEEGEACYNEDDDDNIDPDALSYIDERIRQVLGHFQRDFEGGLTAENLGAKFGGYGSFLPTHKRSPSIWHHERTQRKNCSTPNSVGSLPLEGALQNLKASSNLSQSVRLQTNSCCSDVHNIREPLTSISEIHESCSPLTQAADNCTSKNGSSISSDSLTGLRSLKVRIKVRSDDVAQRNAAIYNGLGLDDSPYTSSGDSLDRCERKSHVEDSPNNIIQVMTSCSIPGGLLISPLPDSLLWLSKKEYPSRESLSMASLNSHLEQSSQLVDETALSQVDAQLLKNKEKKFGVNENQEELKHGNKRRIDGGRKNVLKKKSEEMISRDAKFLANGLKCTPLSNSVGNNNESAKAVGRVREISCDISELGVKDKSFTSVPAEEEMLELGDEQDCRKNDKQSFSSSLLEKASKNKAVDFFTNNLVDIGYDDSSKGNTSASMKECSDAPKQEEDVDLHRKILQKDTFHLENGSYLPSEKGKPAFSGKNKLKGMLGNSETFISKSDNVKAEVGAVPKDKKNASNGVYFCIDNKVEDGQKDFSGNKYVEDVNYCQVTKAGASGDLQNEHNRDSPSVQPTLGKHPSKRPRSMKVDTDSIDRASAKDIPDLYTPISENRLTSDNVPEAVAPLLIEENWVACDRCQKWRLLPFGLKPELPEKWLCSMLYWLPGMNRCDIREEETTAALNALYQLPVSQNHTNGTASGVTTSNDYHLDQNHQNTCRMIVDQGKKKQILKGIKHAGRSSVHVSNSLQNHVQEPGKRRSINIKNYHPEPSSIRKSEVHHVSKLQKMVEEKNEHTLNEKPENGVAAKKLKVKSQRKDNDGFRLSARSKIEDMDVRIVNLNSNFGSRTILRTDMKNNETSFSEDSKCCGKDAILSVRKLGGQTQTSSDGGSLDMPRSKRNTVSQKRKRKEDNPHCQESALDDGVIVKEEISESWLRKEGKAQLMKTEKKVSSSDDGDGNSRKKVRMTPVYSLSSRDFPVATTVVGDFRKDWELGRHEENGSSDTSNAVELQQNDCRSEQVSTVAARSNSKVASSLKTRVKYKEVNESVEQSVPSASRRSGDGAIIGSEMVRKKKSKFCKQEEDGVTMQKFCNNALGSQLYNGDDSYLKEQMGHIRGSIYFSEQFNENGVRKTCNENVKLSQKEVSKEKDMACTSYHKMKESDPFSNCTKKSPKVEPDVRHGSRKVSRNDKNYNGTKISLGKRSIDSGMETQLKDHDCTDLRNGQLSNTNGKYYLQQNMCLNLECESKVNAEKESRSVKSKCLWNSEGRNKKAHERAQDSHEQLLYTSDSEDRLKTTKMSVDCGLENGVTDNLGEMIPERLKSRNLSVSSPDRMESFSKAANTLREAKNLREYADRLKSTGFHFESNEAYFQAALKFFQGASLLETDNPQRGNHGEASQMQFYHAAVELFRACAKEHEKRQEMAAAALAYKCMEVAYLRIVYCQHFCFNKEQQELLTSLQNISQGPQGQTSNEVNLINQTTEDKTVLSMGTTCAARNQAVVSQNQPHFVWLLDFTRIVNLAMEASRKSHNAFAAANVMVEDTQNRDFVDSVKRVIGFSFQDVEELIRLVHLALKFSSYSGFGGTRE